MPSPFGSATVVLQGPGGRLKYDVSGDRTTVGRTKDNEVVLNDPAVSSHHCEFIADTQGLSVRDLRSSNGTYVNGRRVTEGPLYDGDAIKIGQYQGRINVFGVDGKPIRPPGARGPLVAAIAVVALVLLGGLGFALVVKQRRDADASAYATYETRAKEVLALSPCAAAESNVRRLTVMASKLEKPALGRDGKLAKADVARNAELLAQSKKRTEFAEETLTSAKNLLDKHRNGAVELKGVSVRFSDAELQGVARVIESLFVDRTTAGEEFVKEWGKYVEQLGTYHDALEAFARAPSADRGNALADEAPSVDLQKAFDACESRFSKTHQDGLLKLAGVAL